MFKETGDIHQLSESAIKALQKSGDIRRFAMLDTDEARVLSPLSRPKRKNRMRNKPCPCGSGKKFKRCCW